MQVPNYRRRKMSSIFFRGPANLKPFLAAVIRIEHELWLLTFFLLALTKIR